MSNKLKNKLETNLAYVGLGANLKEPNLQIKKALKTINSNPDIELLQHSSLYLSKPMGSQSQSDYFNAVAKLTTSLSPVELLDQLQAIENGQGRIRKSERWGPRTLDLDLLLYNNSEIQVPRLTVPHYGMKERNFVILPLAEIAPDLKLPDGTSITELVKKISKQGIELFC